MMKRGETLEKYAKRSADELEQKIHYMFGIKAIDYCVSPL